MRDTRFDALTRNLSSRRAALGGLLSGVTALLGLPTQQEAAAHDLAARCRKLPDRAKRRACLRRAQRHRQTQHTCRPQPTEVICAAFQTCDGPAFNNCGKLINCMCPAEKSCLTNGSCAQQCVAGAPPCPAGCRCFGPVVEGQILCAPSGIDCPDVPIVCTSTADCPVDQFCLATNCGSGSAGKRCIPLCSG